VHHKITNKNIINKVIIYQHFSTTLADGWVEVLFDYEVLLWHLCLLMCSLTSVNLLLLQGETDCFTYTLGYIESVFLIESCAPLYSGSRSHRLMDR